jgi:hypothetical protein
MPRLVQLARRKFLTTNTARNGSMRPRHRSERTVAGGEALLRTDQYAAYEAHEGRTPPAYQDTTKVWVQLEYVW